MNANRNRPERSEAGFNYTRAQRRATLAQVLARVTHDLTGDDKADTVMAVLYIALQVPKPGENIPVSQAGVVYGRSALEALVKAADNQLAQVAANMEAGEQAKRESLVKGRKGKGNGPTRH